MNFTKKFFLKLPLINIDLKTLYVSIGFSIFCTAFGYILFSKHLVFLFSVWPTLAYGFKNLLVQFFHIFNFVIDFFILVTFTYICLQIKLFYKIVLLGIFTFSFFVECGYNEYYGRFSRPNDLMLALTATGEQRDGMIFSYINLNVLYLLLTYILMDVFYNRKRSIYGIKHFVAILMLFILHATSSFSYYRYMSLKRPEINAYNINANMFFPLPIALNTLINSCFGYMLMDDYISNEKRISLTFSSSTPPVNNIVVIVDETLRADHLSINGYHRTTTPFLQMLQSKKILANYGICVSGSTASVESNNLLLIGETINTGKAAFKHTVNNPTVFQYAKAMNYKTYFFDPQLNRQWAGITDDYNYIDKRLNNKTLFSSTPKLPEYEIDFEIAKQVNEIIKKSRGNFIYIFKRGMHYPYKNNYPESATIYKPVYKYYSAQNATKDELINSYDNAIFYNVDKFFKLLLTDQKIALQNTTIIYTGDHGESLLEDGKTFGHGGVQKLQATVPLFVIGKNISLDTSYKASHANILPTVLDMMHYPSHFVKFPYSISLLKASSKNNLSRKYISPDLQTPKVFYFDEKY